MASSSVALMRYIGEGIGVDVKTVIRCHDRNFEPRTKIKSFSTPDKEETAGLLDIFIYKKEESSVCCHGKIHCRTIYTGV